MFFQTAESPLVEVCYAEGEMHSTDDMLKKEGTDSAADNVDFMTVWGYKLSSGFIMSFGEAGIRTYNAGNTVIEGIAISKRTSVIRYSIVQ